MLVCLFVGLDVAVLLLLVVVVVVVIVVVVVVFVGIEILQTPSLHLPSILRAAVWWVLLHGQSPFAVD